MYFFSCSCLLKLTGGNIAQGAQQIYKHKARRYCYIWGVVDVWCGLFYGRAFRTEGRSRMRKSSGRPLDHWTVASTSLCMCAVATQSSGFLGNCRGHVGVTKDWVLDMHACYCLPFISSSDLPWMDALCWGNVLLWLLFCRVCFIFITPQNLDVHLFMLRDDASIMPCQGRLLDPTEPIEPLWSPSLGIMHTIKCIARVQYWFVWVCNILCVHVWFYQCF